MSARHTMAIAPEVHAVLRESQLLADRVILPARQLERALYAKVIKVLAEFGGKWSRKDNAILIKAGDRAKLLSALESGTVDRAKVRLQKFYTPATVAERLVRFAIDDVDLPAKVWLLEPSAGEGALIRAAFDVLGQRIGPVLAVDIDAEACNALAAANIIPGHEPYAHEYIRHGDFLAFEPPIRGQFHLILQNAPYQKGQAAKHFEHALKFLAPGGVLAAIEPKNFVVPESVARWKGWRLDCEDVEAGAFKESGTNIATTMVRFVRGAA